MPAFGIPAFVLPNITPGKVVQIVSATTSTGVSSSSATYADTGLTATITPTSAANKVLALVLQNGLAKGAANVNMGIRLFRGATLLADIETAVTFTGNSSEVFVGSAGINYVDAPSSAAAVTYKTTFASRTGVASVTVQSNSATSSIVLMEVTP